MYYIYFAVPICKSPTSAIEVVGLVLASGTDLGNVCSTLNMYFNTKRELPSLLVE